MNDIIEKRQSWAHNEEWFDSDTLQDLIDAWGDSEEFAPGRTVYVGDVIDCKPSQWCDADDIIEMMGERAYDECGEFAENYPDVSQDASAELNAFLATWIEKHAKPNFYRVVNVREYTLTEEDLKQ